MLPNIKPVSIVDAATAPWPPTQKNLDLAAELFLNCPTKYETKAHTAACYYCTSVLAFKLDMIDTLKVLLSDTMVKYDDAEMEILALKAKPAPIELPDPVVDALANDRIRELEESNAKLVAAMLELNNKFMGHLIGTWVQSTSTTLPVPTTSTLEHEPNDF